MGRPVILLVDDDSVTRENMAEYLRGTGRYEVVEKGSGEEAIEYISSKVCGVILVDIKMPRANGIEVIRKAREKSTDTGIIVISAWVSDDVSNEALSAGASDYMVKPIDLKVLRMKIEDLLPRADGQ
jgi:two-component system NtrC family response regulator/two-component system response regulator HydG